MERFVVYTVAIRGHIHYFQDGKVRDTSLKSAHEFLLFSLGTLAVIIMNAEVPKLPFLVTVPTIEIYKLPFIIR